MNLALSSNEQRANRRPSWCLCFRRCALFKRTVFVMYVARRLGPEEGHAGFAAVFRPLLCLLALLPACPSRGDLSMRRRPQGVGDLTVCDRYPNRVLCLKVGEATSVSLSDAEMSIMPRVRQNTAPFIPWSQRAHCGHRDRASHTAGQRHWAKWHLVTHGRALLAACSSLDAPARRPFAIATCSHSPLYVWSPNNK